MLLSLPAGLKVEMTCGTSFTVAEEGKGRAAVAPTTKAIHYMTHGKEITVTPPLTQGSKFEDHVVQDIKSGSETDGEQEEEEARDFYSWRRGRM